MPERDLFVELQQSLKEIQKFVQGKIKLKTTTIISKERKILDTNKIRAK